MSDIEIPTKVSDIMTRKVITLGENQTVEKVEQSMDTFRFRHLPVVRGTKLVGLISHRDMLQVSSSSLSSERDVRDQLIHQVPAKRIMRTEVVTLSPDDSIIAAGEQMWDMKVGCLCVTDDDDNLLGIVTEADFVRLAVQLVKHLTTPKPPTKPPSRAPADD
jgi:CBS domain-containing membrane protein